MRVSTLLSTALILVLPASAHAIGILVPTHQGAPLALVSHRVNVEIVERGATTRVTQEFRNSTNQQLEATYLFPLPKGATVKEFALWMNGKREIGKVMERQEARRIYESIVRRARDPGLIEYVDAELFQARIFPIPPNGTQKVELIYSHLVDYEGGTHRYVYPMKTDQQASSTLKDFTFSGNISSKLPIRNIYSPTHKMAFQRHDKNAAAGFEKDAFSLSDDLVLYWSVDDQDVGLTLLSYREGDDPGYFMLLASPKDGFREQEIIGKRVSFVVDVSGSMSGAKMRAVKKALDYCLGRLGDDDLFNIISFGSFVETFSKSMVSASKANVAKARRFVREIDPAGGTNIDQALKTTYKSATGSSRAPHIVVFLTDGQPTSGETDVKTILAHSQEGNKEKARIFVFGVGDDVNTVLLDQMASLNRGSSTYLKGDDSMEAEITAFYDRLSHPVLSDLALDVPDARVYGALPDTLPDLFKGGQLVVLGRYREPGKKTVQLSGVTPSGKQTFSYEAHFAEGATNHEFVPRLWAQRQVGVLLEQVRNQGEQPGLVQEITQLATRFGIVTPYTSYLVVEPNMQPPPRDRPRPSEPRPMDDELSVFSRPSRAQGAAPSAAPSAPASEMLKEESGEKAVETAKAIGALKKSDQAKGRAKTQMARALGRTFHYRDGFFVDERSTSKDEVLAIEAYSEAFFEVLRLRPDLKDALKLGERVKVSVANGRTLVLNPGGAQKVDRAKLEKFLAR